MWKLVNANVDAAGMHYNGATISQGMTLNTVMDS